MHTNIASSIQSRYNVNVIGYSASYIFPFIAYTSIYTAGWWSWVLPVIAFVCIPLLETILPRRQENLRPIDEASRTDNAMYTWILLAFVPVQCGLIYSLISTVGVVEYGVWEWMGILFSVGICCGSFGINVAHELGHRNDRISQISAKILLLTSLYMHFIIEHNRGHHKNVATKHDPASSYRGQTVYHFWCRSIWNGWLDAWNLEFTRLYRKQKSKWHYSNEMLQFTFIQCTVLLIVGYCFSWYSALAYIIVGGIGILLLETINYIEHYGLQRKIRTDLDTNTPKYEKVQPHHSWNSSHSIGRYLLFELTRHSDHHAHAKRPYPVLRHFTSAPQLPFGYPMMILISLIPWFWFKIMHPLLDQMEISE